MPISLAHQEYIEENNDRIAVTALGLETCIVCAKDNTLTLAGNEGQYDLAIHGFRNSLACIIGYICSVCCYEAADNDPEAPANHIPCSLCSLCSIDAEARYGSNTFSYFCLCVE